MPGKPSPGKMSFNLYSRREKVLLTADASACRLERDRCRAIGPICLPSSIEDNDLETSS